MRKFFTSLFAFIGPGVATIIMQGLFVGRLTERVQKGFGRSGANA
ncbi:hypothetical protein ABID19_003695 [Mesorhizobium robiniae]|uniref:Uncharacterized protein n=1 Tax=Mesorhizobium robiniae TaxID=559315 RepID=A0ABV2GQT7_9HYPH